MSIFENVHDADRIWQRLIGLLTVTMVVVTLFVMWIFAVWGNVWVSGAFAVFPIAFAIAQTSKWTAEATARIIGVTATAQVQDLMKERGL